MIQLTSHEVETVAGAAGLPPILGGLSAGPLGAALSIVNNVITGAVTSPLGSGGVVASLSGVSASLVSPFLNANGSGSLSGITGNVAAGPIAGAISASSAGISAVATYPGGTAFLVI